MLCRKTVTKMVLQILGVVLSGSYDYFKPPLRHRNQKSSIYRSKARLKGPNQAIRIYKDSSFLSIPGKSSSTVQIPFISISPPLVYATSQASTFPPADTSSPAPSTGHKWPPTEPDPSCRDTSAPAAPQPHPAVRSATDTARHPRPDTDRHEPA